MSDTSTNADVSLLSIVMPVYNEAATLERIVERVLGVDLGPLERELVIVDDGSADGSQEIAAELAKRDPRIRCFALPRNQGKGAALREGFRQAQGDVVLVQDADLEYDPAEYPRLLAPILDGSADVVYGSRFMSQETRRVLYFWHSLGNKFLTLLSNALNDMTFTDMETCYKVFRTEVLRRIRLRENRFGIEPEITAKISRLRPPVRAYEVGISYHGRTYADGKKIGWRDGVSALRCILRYRFLD
jgi:glycosyltransferase involved in cell wall biosynthesis